MLWSLCNEEGCFEHPDTDLPGLAVGAQVKQLIAAHDGTRAVMAAMNDGMYFAPGVAADGGPPRTRPGRASR